MAEYLQNHAIINYTPEAKHIPVALYQEYTNCITKLDQIFGENILVIGFKILLYKYIRLKNY